MSEWRPIEEYDGMEKKPSNCLFYFIGTPPGRGQIGNHGLPPTIEKQRYFGYRECTLFYIYPEPPC